MKKCKVFIVSGPSGCGKTTLCSYLVRQPPIKEILEKSITYTTRLPRRGERDNKDYHFLSKKEFLSLKKKDFFLETQENFGHSYGTSKKDAKRILNCGKNLLLCIDVKGAMNVKKIFPKAILIFILPPSLATLRQRLKSRRQNSSAEIKKRLAIAKKEISFAKFYDYIIINDRLDLALGRLSNIIRLEAGVKR